MRSRSELAVQILDMLVVSHWMMRKHERYRTPNPHHILDTPLPMAAICCRGGWRPIRQTQYASATFFRSGAEPQISELAKETK